MLSRAGIEATIQDGALRVSLPPEEGARVTETLARHGQFLSELRREEADLETVFLELTKDAPTEAAK